MDSTIKYKAAVAHLAEKRLNDYLYEVVCNMYRCQHCERNHNGICFFAYDCIKDDFKFYSEED